MPRKSVKHTAEPVVEEVKEEKPQILKAEEVVTETPTESDVTPVSQLAQVVEPVKVVESVVIPVKPEVEEKPEEPDVIIESKSKNLWPIWIAIAFVLGAGAGFLLSKFNFEKKPVVKTTQTKEASVSPTVEPTKAPEVVFDRTKIKIKVLNGSGEKGKAASAKEYLEGLGYVEVATGNADEDNYAMTELSVKDSLKENIEKLKADFTNKYELDSKVSTLASDDAFDVLVIIGQK